MVPVNIENGSEEKNDRLTTFIIPFRLYIPSFTLVDIVSYFTSSCEILHTGLTILSKPE